MKATSATCSRLCGRGAGDISSTADRRDAHFRPLPVWRPRVLANGRPSVTRESLTPREATGSRWRSPSAEPGHVSADRCPGGTSCTSFRCHTSRPHSDPVGAPAAQACALVGHGRNRGRGARPQPARARDHSSLGSHGVRSLRFRPFWAYLGNWAMNTIFECEPQAARRSEGQTIWGEGVTGGVMPEPLRF